MADPIPIEGNPFDGAQPVEGNPFKRDVDHSSMFDRIRHGLAIQSVMRKKEEGGEDEVLGAKDIANFQKGFGGQPIGFEPGGKGEKMARFWGVFTDPEYPKISDEFIRPMLEKPLRGAWVVGDSVFRSFNGAIFMGAGATVDAAKSMGMSPRSGAADEVADTVNALLPFLAHPQIMSRMKMGSDGQVRPDPIGSLPKELEFQASAEALSRVAGAEVSEGKLRSLYEEHGVHPAEVLADAAQDQSLAKDLASGSPMLPTRYTGVDPLRMAKDQIESDLAARGAAPRPIADISPELNDALKSRLAWPETKPLEDMRQPAGEPTMSMRFGDHVGRLIDRMDLTANLVRDLQMKVTPMAERNASMDARATAKDFANSMRVAQYDGQLLHDMLTKEFKPEELKRMWDAADKDSVALQKGEAAVERAKLTPRERGVVEALQKRASDAWEDMRQQKGVRGDALPSYAPRMVVGFTDSMQHTPLSLTAIGRNLKTTTSNLLGRKHLEVEATEAAAKEKFGEVATVIRDIRTLNLATARLQEAVAGKKLINAVQELGEKLEYPTVTKDLPKGQESKYFTLDHPSFKTYEPMMARGKDGKFQRVTTEDGSPAFRTVPMHVSKEFEGPLSAVLREKEGDLYRAAMEAKSKAMSLIMFSPLLHNAVIMGRAVPAANANPIALVRLYFDGSKAKADPVFMREMIGNGFVLIGKFGSKFDITSITGEMNVEPGRSITAKLAGLIPDLFDRQVSAMSIAAKAEGEWAPPQLGWYTKNAVDKAGEFWHQKLLWDRVGDLQAGLAKNFFDDMLSRGVDRGSAAKLASHLANRYAGVLSPEAMSDGARKLANVVMFSRSYTLGNLGAMKDMFVGMPRDMLAQIERDSGMQALGQIRSYGMRKAIGIVAVDMALFYAGNSVVQSVIQVLKGDNTLGEEGMGYVERFGKTLKRVAANPYEAMNPFAFMQSLGSTGENEPGKEDKILVGYQSDGTALYMRNPTGKTGEEMIGWMTKPAEMVKNKLSTLVKPAVDVFNNRNFKDQHIYNPYPNTPGKVVDNIAAVVFHFMEAQVPSEALKAIKDLVTGTPTPDEKKIDVLKIAGPLVGLMFSQGAPGGPAVGELMRARKELQFRVEQAMPDIRKAIKENRMDEANAMMDKAGIDPRTQRFLIDATLNPSAAATRRSMQKLMQSLPEEQQDRINRDLERKMTP